MIRSFAFFFLVSFDAFATQVDLVVEGPTYASKFCQGGLVEPDLVVTAAHCLWQAEAFELLNKEISFFIFIRGQKHKVDSWSLFSGKDLGWVLLVERSEEKVFRFSHEKLSSSDFFKIKGRKNKGSSGTPVIKKGKLAGVISRNDKVEDAVIVTNLSVRSISKGFYEKEI